MPQTQTPELRSAETFKYHFQLTPDDGPPVSLQSNDFYELEIEAYQALTQHRSGWAWFIIDGAKCAISLPRPQFIVKLPEGKRLELNNMADPVFENDFRFRSTWRPAS